jgi:2-polyprenyl-3-methyl-5-hydroxy-6-metoxy-1,4-benzoquinol methylase
MHATADHSSHDSIAKNHTCPVWLGYLLASPIRRLFESPAKMVISLVEPGQRILELGPGLGFFTMPLATSVGPDGKVVCVDVQAGMLERLGKRLAKRGLRESVELRQCGPDDLGLDDVKGSFDVATAIHVVHETPSPGNTIRALAASLKKGGHLLLAEPPGHCSREMWNDEASAAEQSGLVRVPHPSLEGRRMLALWRRQGV